VRRIVGMSKKPDSSMKTMWAPSRLAFFLHGTIPSDANSRSRLRLFQWSVVHEPDDSIHQISAIGQHDLDDI
jgi:hypothetical protein